MFKRSLASVAAVAIASGAVVAPANAMTVTINNTDRPCTIEQTAEEANLTNFSPKSELTKDEAAEIKEKNIERKLLDFHAQIEKDQKKLTESNLDEEQKQHLKSQLKAYKEKITANKKLKEALAACIAGENYDSDKSGGTQKPEDQGNPGAPGNPGDSKNPKAPKNPEDPKNPGGTNKPKAPSNPDVQPAPPSNDGAGIGVIFAGTIAAILGILAAALPIIKPMLPPQLRALLP
ncbi:hypothetical protein FRC0024_02100 [Corynebacterium diphtheriae]|nr:hypothetical protein FRC0024_02100 [Corynebacterium diphtheriae]